MNFTSLFANADAIKFHCLPLPNHPQMWVAPTGPDVVCQNKGLLDLTVPSLLHILDDKLHKNVQLVSALVLIEFH